MTMIPLIIFSFLIFSANSSPTLTITINAEETSIFVGRHVKLVAQLNPPANNLTLWPYVNNAQWGSPAKSDSQGSATFLLPIPHVGNVSISVSTSVSSGPFPVGSQAPPNSYFSNVVTVNVEPRQIRKPVEDPLHLVGIEWEFWFTQTNAHWDLSEGAPLVGYYDSFNLDVVRQHMLWIVEAGMNVIYVDWTNNLWSTPHWDDRNENIQELCNATLKGLSVLAQMQSEGIYVPKVVFLLGLDNGPVAPSVAINEEIEWIYNTLVSNPQYKDLWVIYQGKPLIVVFDGGNEHSSVNPPINDSKMTIRWMASQLQVNNLNQQGFWSWMDGTYNPPPTLYKGKVEAQTITNAFFAQDGWLYTGVGQDGGNTYMVEFANALNNTPNFLIICQWNEFTGQAQGQGYGPNHDQYYDIYNVSLSNDMEPTSLNIEGYRSNSPGWGFFWVNMLRATTDLYQTKLGNLPGPFDSVLLVISSPQRYQQFSKSDQMLVSWNILSMGLNHTELFNVYVDTHLVGRTTANQMALNLNWLASGEHTISVVASDFTTRYPLSLDTIDDPLQTPVPSSCSIPFELK